MSQRYKLQKRVWLSGILVFMMMNIVACFHAYKFTHFAPATLEKTKHAQALTAGEKVGALLLGVNNPRPVNKTRPGQPFRTVLLQSNRKLEGWHIRTANSKGTVILFPGYSAGKSLMLDKSDEFIGMGYSTFLVDFRGTGGSEGNQTTIGYHEAQDVKACFDYLARQRENNIILFGTSMGAVAILKAAKDYSLHPAGAVLECPFGSMYQTTCARFRQMGVPCFPMAGLLVFWGGVQNGFHAFAHNPHEYARQVTFPVLLLYGEKDAEVSRAETEEIYAQLGGKKTLRTYPKAAHENYLKQYKSEWREDVSGFLETLTSSVE